MRMEFEFKADEVAATMKAVSLRMQELARHPATDENYAEMLHLGRFISKLKSVIDRGLENEREPGRVGWMP